MCLHLADSKQTIVLTILLTRLYTLWHNVCVVGQTLNGGHTVNNYQLVWSPEGRPIGAVKAKDTRAAIRKADKPYRKHLGEIYAKQFEIKETIDGRFMVTFDGLQWGKGPRDESGSSSQTWDTEQAAFEAVRNA